jgi:hypothetical protein
VTERVTTVWADLVRRPGRYFIAGWNWKSAVTSTVIRGSIYFFANVSAGLGSATSAAVTEFCYRTLLSGASGSVTQALRSAEPEWAAALSATVTLPLCSHTVEFTIHLLRGTPRLKHSFIASLCFTAISTLFNAYAMRRGVLVTGSGSTSLAQDFAAMPRIVAGFLVAIPKALWRTVQTL